MRAPHAACITHVKKTTTIPAAAGLVTSPGTETPPKPARQPTQPPPPARTQPPSALQVVHPAPVCVLPRQRSFKVAPPAAQEVGCNDAEPGAPAQAAARVHHRVQFPLGHPPRVPHLLSVGGQGDGAGRACKEDVVDLWRGLGARRRGGAGRRGRGQCWNQEGGGGGVSRLVSPSTCPTGAHTHTSCSPHSASGPCVSVSRAQ